MRRMFRSVLLKFLLVFALLFVQQGAIAHGISHVLAEQSQDRSLPHDQHCELCAAYAQVGSALGSDSIQFDLPPPAFEAQHEHDVALPAIPFAAFAARAPPRSA